MKKFFACILVTVALACCFSIALGQSNDPGALKDGEQPNHISPSMVTELSITLSSGSIVTYTIPPELMDQYTVAQLVAMIETIDIANGAHIDLTE